MIGKIKPTNFITVLKKIQKDIESVLEFTGDNKDYYVSYLRGAHYNIETVIKYISMDKNDEKRTG